MNEYLTRLLSLETACIADVMERKGVMLPSIKSMTGNTPMAGIARTTRAVPGDADSVLVRRISVQDEAFAEEVLSGKSLTDIPKFKEYISMFSVEQ